MAFHEIRFPTSLSFGAVGGPERRTEIVTLANGFEERNTPWAHARRRYDAGLGMRSLDDLETVIAFFEARQGQLAGFRWKDWSDYKSCPPSQEVSALDQLIAVGDEVTQVMPLTKTYRSGDQSYTRPIAKPVAGSVRIAVGGDPLQEGIDYTVDVTTGSVSFIHPPDLGAEVRAGYIFDVPVRFDTDAIMTSVSGFQAGEAPNVPIVEIRV
ncbi:phage distal tail protein, Rcc01695 family [Yoonia sp.]|uniref:phage distal tail protein, Rcc01695 family n=1 Tax=Yoonia sp. TaxID=2212373 RepID=UPI003F6B7E97